MSEHEEPKKEAQSSLEENRPTQESLKLDLNKEQKKELAELIHNNWDQADAARTAWLVKKETGLNLYWGIRGKKDFPFKNCANLHVPLIRTIKETLFSNLMGSLDFIEPVSVTPVGPEDLPKSKKVKKLLNWQFTSQVDFFDIADKLVDSALIDGIGIAKLRYVKEKTGKVTTFDGIKLDILKPERFLIPPDASSENVDSWDYCIQEIPMNKSDLKKRIASKMYAKPEADFHKLGTEPSSASTDSLLENLRSFYSGIESTESETSTVSRPAKNYIVVLEWYGYFDYNNDGIEEPVVASYLKETRELLRCVKWEGPRPFKLVVFSPILHKPVGESVSDLLSRINEELNLLHNQRVDAVTIHNIPFGFYDPMAGFNPNEVHLTPGLMIPVNGSPSQAVYFPSLQLSMPEMYREEESLFLYAERMLGAGANIQGILQPKRISATEVSAIDRRAGIRFLTLFNRIRRGFKGIFDLALYLDQEYLPEEIQVRITGLDDTQPLFESMKRKDVVGKFDIIVNGNSIVDEQAEKQEQLQLYQLGTLNPLIMRDEIALYELTKDTFVKLGAKNINSYLRRPEDSIPKNPQEEHNLFLQEETVKPNIGENIDLHLKEHAELINSENFKLLTPKGQMLAMQHYLDTRRMREILDIQDKIRQLQAVNSQLLQSQVTGEGPGQSPEGPSNGQRPA